MSFQHRAFARITLQYTAPAWRSAGCSQACNGSYFRLAKRVQAWNVPSRSWIFFIIHIISTERLPQRSPSNRWRGVNHRQCVLRAWLSSAPKPCSNPFARSSGRAFQQSRRSGHIHAIEDPRNPRHHRAASAKPDKTGHSPQYGHSVVNQGIVIAREPVTRSTPRLRPHASRQTGFFCLLSNPRRPRPISPATKSINHRQQGIRSP